MIIPELMRLLSLTSRHRAISVFVIAALLFICGLFYVDGLKSDIARLNNEVAKQRGITKIAVNTYEEQALVLDDMKIENENLKNRLDETDREATAYMNLSLEYKAEIDSIETFTADTAYINKDSIVVHEATDRLFYI